MAIIEWLVSLPVWLTFVVVIVFWMTVATTLWWLAKTLVPHEKIEKHRDTAVRILTTVSAFYAFLLGFVVSQEWSNVNTVRNDVASASAQLYIGSYNAVALPKPSSNEALGALQSFGNSIVCQDFPSLARSGRPSAQTGEVLEKSFSTITSLPSSAQSAPTFSDVMSSLESASESRRQWVSAAADGLPTVILVIILLVAFILLGAFSIQFSASQRAHLLALLGISVFIGLGTGLVIALNRPFAGAAKINSAAFIEGANRKTFDCSKTSKGSAQWAPHPPALRASR
ncbi:MAG: hypothetical protein ACKOB9_01480 [Solirubrobacterales bacterium]